MDPVSIEGVMMFAQSKCPLGACAWPVAAGLAGLVIGIVLGLGLFYVIRNHRNAQKTKEE